MKGTKLTVKFTSAFKRDFKLAMKRNRKIQLLENIVAMLANGETLPPKNRDHELTGNSPEGRNAAPLFLCYAISRQLRPVERRHLFREHSGCRLALEVRAADDHVGGEVRIAAHIGR